MHHYKPRFVYFYPIFHCSSYCRVVNIADNLCSKEGNSSKKSASYNGAYTVIGFECPALNSNPMEYLNFAPALGSGTP